MTNGDQTRWAVTVIAIVALGIALKAAQPVLAPLALAFVVAVVLSPVSDFWLRMKVPNTMAAILSFGVGLLLVLVLALALEPIVRDVYAQWPVIRTELRQAVYELRDMTRGVTEMTDEVQKAISPEAGSAQDNAGTDAVAVPTLTDALFLAPAFAGQLVIFGGGLFFVLLCRGDVYTWLAQLREGGSKSDTAASVNCFRDADRQVAVYFLTIGMINAAFGALVAITFTIFGIPGALVWGVIGGLMNFVVYLGPAVVAVALLMAGIVSFDGVTSLLPMSIFVGLNFLEGQFVTPALIGRRMSVNPLLVFLSLCLWLWLWGAIGGIVAIPLLVWAIAVGKSYFPGNNTAPVDVPTTQPRKLTP